MSKWIIEYDKVIEKIEKIEKILEVINCQNDKECIRLKRVFNDLYKLLFNLDPELISFKDYLNLLYSGRKNIGYTDINCQNYIAKLSEYISKKEFNKANNIIDEINRIIKPYILHKKRFGDPLVKSVKLYQEELEKYLNELKNIETEEHNLQEIIERIYEYNNELFEGNDEKLSIKSKIDSLIIEVEKQKEKINKFYDELFIEYDNEISIQSSINEFLKDIKDIRQESETLKDEIENILVNSRNTIKDLKEFHVEIFGEENEETGKLKGGLKKEIYLRQKDLDNLKLEHEKNLNKQKESFEKIIQKQEQKYKQLENKIESLLPGATSAGLAKAFEEKRLKFEKDTSFWNKIFIISMIGIFIGGLFTIQDFDKIKSFHDTLIHIIKYLPLYAPAFWLAFYSAKRRNENMRLEQKYAHKESLAKSYISYKKQIEELESEIKDEILENLLKTSTYTLSEDPSYVLDKNNNEHHPFVETLANFFENMKFNKHNTENKKESNA